MQGENPPGYPSEQLDSHLSKVQEHSILNLTGGDNYLISTQVKAKLEFREVTHNV